MSLVTFSDVVFSHISFPDTPFYRLVLETIDNPWVQRLRDISQTANTKLVYMTSEHSRFSHCLGVTYMADLALRKMSEDETLLRELKEWRDAIVLASLLHDVGHLAPGSHVAFKLFFSSDDHEELSIRIIDELTHIPYELREQIKLILKKDSSIPPFAWQLLAGSGWNVDRGNWCVLDSIFAGVKYGFYNINAILESLTITSDLHLAIKDNRIDSLIHFSVSRYALYRQVYQHRVILGIDALSMALARAIKEFGVNFADGTMRAFLSSSCGSELPLEAVFKSRESWWNYHLMRWQDIGNPDIVRDLADRLINRKLFKTIGHSEKAEAHLRSLIADAGLNPDYYLHIISTKSIADGDAKDSLKVISSNRDTVSHTNEETLRNASLSEVDPLFSSLQKIPLKKWLLVPKEIKEHYYDG